MGERDQGRAERLTRYGGRGSRGSEESGAGVLACPLAARSAHAQNDTWPGREEWDLPIPIPRTSTAPPTAPSPLRSRAYGARKKAAARLISGAARPQRRAGGVAAGGSGKENSLPAAAGISAG
jgi:hypothetical protein